MKQVPHPDPVYIIERSPPPKKSVAVELREIADSLRELKAHVDALAEDAARMRLAMAAGDLEEMERLVEVKDPR